MMFETDFPAGGQDTGLTKREWMATQILAAAIQSDTEVSNLSDEDLDRASEQCFRIADSILRVSKRTETWD